MGEQSAPLRLHIFDGFGGLHLKDTPVSNMFFYTNRKITANCSVVNAQLDQKKVPFIGLFPLWGSQKCILDKDMSS